MRSSDAPAPDPPGSGGTYAATVRPSSKSVVAVLLVALVAILGIAANFALLGLTQDSHDPVGRLSPRATVGGDTSPRPSPSSGTTSGEDHEEPDEVEEDD